MRYLVIGASGFLGQTVYYKLKSLGKEVWGTYSSHKIDHDCLKLDVMDTKELLNIYERYKPDVIIWTVMNASIEEEIAEKSIRVLTEQMQQTKIIFISTSVAYERDMDESVKPQVRSNKDYNYHYFNGKIKSEAYITQYKNYCIVRSGSIYGTTPYGEIDIRQKVLKEHIDQRKPYYRAEDIVFSIVEVNELAEAILELADNDYVGIINVSEEQPVNHYEFNLFLCRLNGWDSSWVKPYKEYENIYYLNNSLRKKVLHKRLRGDD